MGVLAVEILSAVSFAISLLSSILGLMPISSSLTVNECVVSLKLTVVSGSSFLLTVWLAALLKKLWYLAVFTEIEAELINVLELLVEIALEVELLVADAMAIFLNEVVLGVVLWIVFLW